MDKCGSHTTSECLHISLCPTRILPLNPHSMDCDNCRRSIDGPLRIICMDCPRTHRALIDLCPTLRCTGSEVPLSRRSDLPRPHIPSHSLLRLPYVMHLGMESYTLEHARDAVKRAESFFGLEPEVKTKPTGDKETGLRKLQTVSDLKTDDTKSRCAICKKVAMPPCWFCADCEGDAGPTFSAYRCEKLVS